MANSNEHYPVEAGVQAMFLVARREDVSEERFHYHYRHIHGELAREILSRPSGGRMNRYVQSHRIGTSLPGLPPLSFEAVGEAWFDSTQEMSISYERESFTQRIVPDGWLFTDDDRTIWFNTRSRIVRRAHALPPAAARAIIVMRRSKRLDEAAFAARWDAHAAYLDSLTGLIEIVQTEVVSEEPRVLPDGSTRAASGWTAVESLTFPDVMELELRWRELQDDFLADLATFAEVDGCAALVAAAQRIY